MTSPNPLDAIAAEMKAAAERAIGQPHATMIDGRYPWDDHHTASNPANVLAVLEAYEKLKLELKTTHG